ncbi:MAG: acetyl-CoA carboxylase biotin carboxyl carrier protein subunit [Acidobacteriota bacterium]
MIELISTDGEEARIRVDGRVHTIPYVVQGGTVSFSFDGELYFVEAEEKGGRARARHRDHSMEAPMPGAVLRILVKAGDVVTKGAPLLILEAMKMEHQLTAPRDGTIEAIHCREGELVQPGVELVTMKPLPKKEG